MIPAHQLLEQEFAASLQMKAEHFVAVASGTAALHLAMQLVCPEQSTIAMPNLTMVACPRAAVLASLSPTFYDCDDSLLMKFDKTVLHELECCCTALLAVHIYGRRVEIPPEVFGKLHVIEDMAEYHGNRPYPGTSAACWSFYKNKVIHGEEGGMIYFKAASLAAEARSLRSLGFTEAHDFYHRPGGMNYRLADLLAEPILRSLKNYATNLDRRRRMVDVYFSRTPKEWQMPGRTCPWVYDLRIPGLTEYQQNVIVAYLLEKGVQARHCFKPMTEQEEFKHHATKISSVNCTRLSREVIYLPLNVESYANDDYYAAAEHAMKELKCIAKVIGVWKA
jgi:dTDP-4-amino-4,6-dideoxygalactose transaminase